MLFTQSEAYLNVTKSLNRIFLENHVNNNHYNRKMHKLTKQSLCHPLYVTFGNSKALRMLSDVYIVHTEADSLTVMFNIDMLLVDFVYERKLS